MKEKIKGYQYTDILTNILAPLTLYLFIGLVVISLSGIEVSTAYYVFWGIMAVIAVGIREYVRSAMVTVGIGIYVMMVAVWFYRYQKGRYQIHTVLAIVGLGAVFVLWELLKYKVVRVLIGYAALSVLIGFEFADIHFSKGIIALAIFLFLYSVSESLSTIHSFIVIYVVLALIVMITPAPEEAYSWRFVISAVNTIGNTINKVAETISVEAEYQLKKWGWDGVFHYGVMGYSDSSMDLSMGVGDRSIEQMTLWGVRTTRNLYLKGNVCDTYTGDSWETRAVEETMDYQTDFLMTLYAIFDYVQNEQELRRFAKVYTQELTIQNIKTQSLFYPLKTYELAAQNIQMEGDNLRANRVLNRGSVYTYRFVDVDYASEAMIEVMTRSKNITYNEEAYDELYNKMWRYFGIRMEKIPYSDFVANVTKGQTVIKEQYTTLGDAVSDEVKKLADSITAECRNDYEKCKALEEYLYQYNYNKNINVPDDANALDWFLFEGKEGYCVHYATALAAMLRCEGIPARIAEGFLVEYDNRVGSNKYSISSSSAHVWVEAYLDGVGWIRLEPTVAFAGNAYEKWYSNVIVDEEDEEDEEEESESSELSDEEEQMQEATEGKGQEDVGVFLAILLGGTAATAGVLFLVVFVYHKIRRRKSNNPDVVLAHILSILGKKYAARKDEETVREYFRRLCETEQMTDELRGNLKIITELAEPYWYGTRMISEQDVCKMKKIRDEFLGG